MLGVVAMVLNERNIEVGWHFGLVAALGFVINVGAVFIALITKLAGGGKK